MAASPPSAPSPVPSPVRPPHIHPERERGATAHPETDKQDLLLGWWRPLPLGVGGGWHARGRVGEGAAGAVSPLPAGAWVGDGRGAGGEGALRYE